MKPQPLHHAHSAPTPTSHHAAAAAAVAATNGGAFTCSTNYATPVSAGRLCCHEWHNIHDVLCFFVGGNACSNLPCLTRCTIATALQPH